MHPPPSRRITPLLTTTLFGAITGLVAIYLLVLGSGILPMSFAALLRLAVPATAGAGLLVAAATPRRFPWLRLTLTAVLALWIAGAVFKHAIHRAELAACHYAEQVAVLLERTAALNGRWPATLAEIPGLDRVPVPPAPYLSYPDASAPKVAGFFITYEPHPPRLLVARRGYGLQYNL